MSGTGGPTAPRPPTGAAGGDRLSELERKLDHLERRVSDLTTRTAEAAKVGEEVHDVRKALNRLGRHVPSAVSQQREIRGLRHRLDRVEKKRRQELDGRSTSRLLIVLVVFVAMLTAYGVVQPSLPFVKGKSLAIEADELSVLISTIALFIAVGGYGAYRVLQAEAQKTVDDAVNRHTKEWRGKITRALEGSRLNEVFSMWPVIEPLLMEKTPDDEHERLIRKDLLGQTIFLASSAARSAYNFVTTTHERDGRTDEQRADENRSLAANNLAYYLACYFHYVDPKNYIVAGEALSYLPPPAPDPEKVDWWLRETSAWVRLCCCPKGSPQYAEAAHEARRIYLKLLKARPEGDPAAAASMRARYLAAFDLAVTQQVTPVVGAHAPAGSAGAPTPPGAGAPDSSV